MIRYVCSHCGAFAKIEDEWMIDSGTTVTCGDCGKETVIDLFTPDQRREINDLKRKMVNEVGYGAERMAITAPGMYWSRNGLQVNVKGRSVVKIDGVPTEVWSASICNCAIGIFTFYRDDGSHYKDECRYDIIGVCEPNYLPF